jgi:hypothetical protein
MTTANAAAAAATMQQPPVTTTTEEEEEEEATSNNNSDSILGCLFLTHEGERTTYNPINDTHIEVSFVGNTTIMPPNATTTINATESGNATLNIQPNGVALALGQVFLLTHDDDGEATQKETQLLPLSKLIE